MSQREKAFWCVLGILIVGTITSFVMAISMNNQRIVYLQRSIERGSSAPRVQLIGRCHGQLYAAMQKEQFPAPCEWIEPIREQRK